MDSRPPSAVGRGAALVGVALLLVGASGCATVPLDTARSRFYRGEADSASLLLNETPLPGHNRVLFHMERGMIRQACGDYEGSAADFIAASDLLEELETYSVSKGGASLVVNDSVQDFRGAPFERTLLHAFTAKDHLARGRWDEAAVESRRIIDALAPERLGNYPADAYSLYMAGFGLEMIDDWANAALQYRRAGELAPALRIDPGTGRLSAAATNGTAQAAADARGPAAGAELVCFVLAGRAVEWSFYGEAPAYDSPVYGEIVCNGRRLGRSWVLADTVALAQATEQVEAARLAVKTLSRIAIKEGIAEALEANDHDLLGALARFVLIGMLEQPDERRWETLPRWLSVARVPCPPDLKEFDVVLRTEAGAQAGSVHVTAPITRRRATFVAFCRDLPVR